MSRFGLLLPEGWVTMILSLNKITGNRRLMSQRKECWRRDYKCPLHKQEGGKEGQPLRVKGAQVPVLLLPAGWFLTRHFFLSLSFSGRKWLHGSHQYNIKLYVTVYGTRWFFRKWKTDLVEEGIVNSACRSQFFYELHLWNTLHFTKNFIIYHANWKMKFKAGMPRI